MLTKLGLLDAVASSALISVHMRNKNDTALRALLQRMTHIIYFLQAKKLLIVCMRFKVKIMYANEAF